MHPSIRTVEATFAVRAWLIRYRGRTGVDPDADALDSQIRHLYPNLKGPDREYVRQHCKPQAPKWP